jgi:hypothetical protein
VNFLGIYLALIRALRAVKGDGVWKDTKRHVGLKKIFLLVLQIQLPIGLYFRLFQVNIRQCVKFQQKISACKGFSHLGVGEIFEKIIIFQIKWVVNFWVMGPF